jgi:hypothetical protein
VTGLINQELLLKNEYLAAENRILQDRLPARLRLSDPERSTLAEVVSALRPEGAGAGGLCYQNSKLSAYCFTSGNKWNFLPLSVR